MNKYDKLKEIRIKYNYSCSDVAKFLNVSRTYYWQLENKKRNLSYKMAKEIAAVFNTKPDNLFFED